MFNPASNVGFTAAMNILNQGRTVLFARSIEDGLNIVRSSSVTCIIASTRHMDDLVSLSAQTSGGVGVLPSVQRVIMGGSYMPASLLERIRTVFRCNLPSLRLHRSWRRRRQQHLHDDSARRLN